MTSLLSKVSAGYRWILQPALVLCVLLFGFIGAKWLTSKEAVAPHLEQRTYSPLVRVQATEPVETPIRILATGALAARTKVNLVAQVSGRVIEIHPGFRSGGRFEKNEVLLRIEPTDYELAVARAQSEVSAARTALQVLQAEAESAREEWRLLNGELAVPTLVAKEPQLQAAQARIDAAAAALAGAKLNLERTELGLPWAGRILVTTIDVGSVVNLNQVLASAYSTEVFELSVPLRQDQLRWVHLPGERLPEGTDPVGPEPITVMVAWPHATRHQLENELLATMERGILPIEGIRALHKRAGAGFASITLEPTGEFASKAMLEQVQDALHALPSFPPLGAKAPDVYFGEAPSTADVRVTVAGRKLHLLGRAVRIESELDAVSRFARLLIEVDTSELAADVAPRFLPGLFAEVTLEGERVHDVTPIPRSSLRGNDTVWTVTDGRLHITPIEPVHHEGETAWVRGLQAGTEVVTSDLEVVTDNMQVRTQLEIAPNSPSPATSEAQVGAAQQ